MSTLLNFINRPATILQLNTTSPIIQNLVIDLFKLHGIPVSDTTFPRPDLPYLLWDGKKLGQSRCLSNMAIGLEKFLEHFMEPAVRTIDIPELGDYSRIYVNTAEGLFKIGCQNVTFYAVKKLRELIYSSTEQPKFKEGDVVKVVNNGESYTTYGSKFTELGFKNKESNPILNHGTVAKIFGISKHGDDTNYIVAIRDMVGNESLIGESGLELIFSEPDSKRPVSVNLTADLKAVVSPEDRTVCFLHRGSQSFFVGFDQLKEVFEIVK